MYLKSGVMCFKISKRIAICKITPFQESNLIGRSVVVFCVLGQEWDPHLKMESRISGYEIYFGANGQIVHDFMLDNRTGKKKKKKKTLSFMANS
jgi:hypothetical protein